MSLPTTGLEPALLPSQGLLSAHAVSTTFDSFPSFLLLYKSFRPSSNATWHLQEAIPDLLEEQNPFILSTFSNLFFFFRAGFGKGQAK